MFASGRSTAHFAANFCATQKLRCLVGNVRYHRAGMRNQTISCVLSRLQSKELHIIVQCRRRGALPI